MMASHESTAVQSTVFEHGTMLFDGSGRIANFHLHIAPDPKRLVLPANWLLRQAAEVPNLAGSVLSASFAGEERARNLGHEVSYGVAIAYPSSPIAQSVNELITSPDGLTVGVQDLVKCLLSGTTDHDPHNVIFHMLEEVPETEPNRELAGGRLTLDYDESLAMVDNIPVQLSPKLYQLLSLFMANPGKVVTREQISDTLWGEGMLVSDELIDQHIYRLRTTLGEVGSKTIQTKLGIGYRALSHQLK